MPLHEATAVAHHLIFERSPARRAERDLDAIRSELTLALAAVGRILAREANGLRLLTMAEVEALTRPPARRDRPALYMTRGDLIDAIELLRQSRKAGSRM
ncbi:MAG TPA: hypothetical protein VG873_04395 [Burkholderiales bacterium]|nr:hypothetical protein [Burkholderiales bacterium]